MHLVCTLLIGLRRAHSGVLGWEAQGDSFWTLCRLLQGSGLGVGDSVVKKPINMNNFSGLSREWVGVKFVYVLFLGETRKHISKFPRKFQENAGTVPGQSPG